MVKSAKSKSKNSREISKKWSSMSPKPGEERKWLMKTCGPKCFLRPSNQTFPVCAKCSKTCKPECKGLLAAKMRAIQWKYPDIEAKALMMSNKLCSCKKSLKKSRKPSRKPSRKQQSRKQQSRKQQSRKQPSRKQPSRKQPSRKQPSRKLSRKQQSRKPSRKQQSRKPLQKYGNKISNKNLKSNMSHKNLKSNMSHKNLKSNMSHNSLNSNTSHGLSGTLVTKSGEILLPIGAKIADNVEKIILEYINNSKKTK